MQRKIAQLMESMMQQSQQPSAGHGEGGVAAAATPSRSTSGQRRGPGAKKSGRGGRGGGGRRPSVTLPGSALRSLTSLAAPSAAEPEGADGVDDGRGLTPVPSSLGFGSSRSAKANRSGDNNSRGHPRRRHRSQKPNFDETSEEDEDDEGTEEYDAFGDYIFDDDDYDDDGLSGGDDYGIAGHPDGEFMSTATYSSAGEFAHDVVIETPFPRFTGTYTGTTIVLGNEMYVAVPDSQAIHFADTAELVRVCRYIGVNIEHPGEAVGFQVDGRYYHLHDKGRATKLSITAIDGVRLSLPLLSEVMQGFYPVKRLPVAGDEYYTWSEEDESSGAPADNTQQLAVVDDAVAAISSATLTAP